MIMKMFDGDELLYELLLTRRQKTKLRNAFENSMATDIKLSGGFLGALLSKIAGPLTKVVFQS